MNGKSKLTHQQQQAEQEQTERQQELQSQNEKQFETVEDMLRFDSSQNPVPGKVAERLQQSVEKAKIKPGQPWWKRLLGK